MKNINTINKLTTSSRQLLRSTNTSILRHSHNSSFNLTSSFSHSSASRILSVRSICTSSSSSLHFASPSAAAPSASGIIEFNLADIGEGIAECEVLKWFVKEGDTIAQFDKVCEVQSDKANVEITSRYDGVVKSLKYKVGQLAKVGHPLMTIQLSGAGAAAGDATPAAPAASTPSSSAPAASASSPAASAVDVHALNEKVLTSPAVRRIAKEENVNLALVTPTGPNGRIIKEDVLRYISNGGAAAAPASSSPSSSPSSSSSSSCAVANARATQPQVVNKQSSNNSESKPQAKATSYLEHDQVVTIGGLQRIMVQTMTAANAVPQLGFSDEISVDKLHETRDILKKICEKQYGVKLSYMPFMIKAASLALKQYPSLNAHTNADCSQVVYKASHNIGLAMDTPRGLLVPNIKNVQNKSVLEIAQEMKHLSELGKEGKLGRNELTGGTFTLSNIGTIGGTYLSPILVVPEVVIGALGAIQTLPRFDAEGNVRAAKIFNISWSADHRVVDGASMARFSNVFKYYLENPQAMLLETK